ncbi:hypothetical protein [Thiofaba sp. EF100]|uniref:hypothetical protein n=1 Tax=Thiofaba sp. EF100 TaxID=3121274 RepID=UPI0032221B8B
MVTEAVIPGWIVPLAVLLVSGMIGAAVWTVRTMAIRLISELDRRLARIDEVAAEVTRVDADLKKLMIELPMHYQRREDAIRETTVVLARIDAVGARIDQFVRREDHIRAEALVNAKLDALTNIIMGKGHENH